MFETVLIIKRSRAVWFFFINIRNSGCFKSAVSRERLRIFLCGLQQWIRHGIVVQYM